MRHLLTCTLSLCILTLSAQGYRAIPSTGAVFKQEEIHWATMGWPKYNIQFSCHQFTDGDTMVDGRSVTRISWGPTACCHFEHTSYGTGCEHWVGDPASSHPGLLWQDTIAGKVYWTVPGDSLHLIFDFSANVGDMINCDLPDKIFGTTDPWSMSFRVDSVDTVMYADGIPRRRLFTTTFSPTYMYYNDHIWVEGIGDLNKGLLPFPDQAGYTPTLHQYAMWTSCYQEFGIDLATGIPGCNFGPSCSSLVSKAEIAEEEKPALISNPGAVLQITGIHLPAEIEVSGLNGKVLLRQYLPVDGSVVGTQGLAAGVYLITVRSSTGAVFHAKWVKTT